MMSFRDCHSVAGRSQESDFVPSGTSAFQRPGPAQLSQPAAAAEVLEERELGGVDGTGGCADANRSAWRHGIREHRPAPPGAAAKLRRPKGRP